MMRWQELLEELNLVRIREQNLVDEWIILKEKCKHPSLPKRKLGEEYSDTCPDCGYRAYCYSI